MTSIPPVTLSQSFADQTMQSLSSLHIHLIALKIIKQAVKSMGPVGCASATQDPRHIITALPELSMGKRFLSPEEELKFISQALAPIAAILTTSFASADHFIKHGISFGSDLPSPLRIAFNLARDPRITGFQSATDPNFIAPPNYTIHLSVNLKVPHLHPHFVLEEKSGDTRLMSTELCIQTLEQECRNALTNYRSP